MRNYLPTMLGASVEEVRAEFSREIANKRIYCETKWPEKGVPAEIVQRALTVLHPTGRGDIDQLPFDKGALRLMHWVQDNY